MTALRHQNHSVSLLQYHFVIAPKYRKAALVNGIDDRLKEIVHELAKEKNWDIEGMEVMPNHVHFVALKFFLFAF